jgi:hypothetical protein
MSIHAILSLVEGAIEQLIRIIGHQHTKIPFGDGVIYHIDNGAGEYKIVTITVISCGPTVVTSHKNN